jgi:hypothetical protein
VPAAVCRRCCHPRQLAPVLLGSSAESLRTRTPSIITALAGAMRARSSVTKSLRWAWVARSPGTQRNVSRAPFKLPDPCGFADAALPEGEVLWLNPLCFIFQKFSITHDPMN